MFFVSDNAGPNFIVGVVHWLIWLLPFVLGAMTVTVAGGWKGPKWAGIVTGVWTLVPGALCLVPFAMMLPNLRKYGVGFLTVLPSIIGAVIANELIWLIVAILALWLGRRLYKRRKASDITAQTFE